MAHTELDQGDFFNRATNIVDPFHGFVVEAGLSSPPQTQDA
jgi:hypothetical protein